MSEQTLRAILVELQRQNQSGDALWDAGDIARYMKLSKSTVQSRIICRQHFPRAVRIPTSCSGMGGRRWLAREVKQWVMRHREPVH